MTPPLKEVDGRLVVGELNTGSAVGRASRLQAVDRLPDRFLADTAGRREHQSRIACVDDDRDRVVLAQPFHEHVETGLNERKFLRSVHRTGDIDQEHEVARRTPIRIHFARLDPDANQAVCRIPGRCSHFHVRRDWSVACRLRIVVVEVVHQLFNAHGISWAESGSDSGTAAHSHTTPYRHRSKTWRGFPALSG